MELKENLVEEMNDYKLKISKVLLIRNDWIILVKILYLLNVLNLVYYYI